MSGSGQQVRKRGRGGEQAGGGAEIPAEECRMDGWLHRTPRRGRREERGGGGKLDRGEGTQDEDRE